MTAHALSSATNSIDGLCAVIDRAYSDVDYHAASNSSMICSAAGTTGLF